MRLFEQTKKIFIILLLSPLSLIATAQNSPFIAAVDEYVPAPGQFINTMPAYEEGDDAETMARKCTDYLANDANKTVCLGAWGGYITFHFDHPLVNVAGEMDLYIKGNAHTGNSEAGIVMVSQDVNANGLPDDPWYELSGSADEDDFGVRYDYELEYTKLGDSLGIAWSNNLGNAGFINQNPYHQQDYFPAWLDSTLTFTGTLLPDNATDTSGNGTYWVLEPFRYGYADNLPNADTLGCSFNIDWAVDLKTREGVNLRFVDFVRVYTALHQDCGWIGETSTEISGAEDLHPEAQPASLEVISLHRDETTISFDLFGRKASAKQTGFIIKGNKLIWNF